jgi:hypothetical protein
VARSLYSKCHDATFNGSLPLREPVTPLRADHAFVLQLQKSRGGAEACRCGRVEHLATGQATRFNTPAEFWDFVEEVLTELARHERERRQGRSC